MRPAVQLLLPGLFDLPADEVDPDFVRRRLHGLNRLLCRWHRRCWKATTAAGES